MRSIAPVLVALCWLSATLRAEVYRTAVGSDEHVLVVAGGVGLYIRGPVGSAGEKRTACVVRILRSDVAGIEEARRDGAGGVPLAADSQSDCGEVPLRLDEKKQQLLLQAPKKWTRMKTETLSEAKLVFGDHDAAWRALASFANKLTDCGIPRAHEKRWDVTCEPGLTLSASQADGVLLLQSGGSGSEVHCTTFPDAYDFARAEIRETTACFRTGVFGGLDGRAELERVLGRCTEKPKATLHCGGFQVLLDRDGKPSSLSR